MGRFYNYIEESTGRWNEFKKSEIIETIATITGLTKVDVTKVFEATFNLIKEELVKENDVAVLGFGTFIKSERAARTGRNPQTGETIQISASKSVSFKASKTLKMKWINNIWNITICDIFSFLCKNGLNYFILELTYTTMIGGN